MLSDPASLCPDLKSCRLPLGLEGRVDERLDGSGVVSLDVGE